MKVTKLFFAILFIAHTWADIDKDCDNFINGTVKTNYIDLGADYNKQVTALIKAIKKTEEENKAAELRKRLIVMHFIREQIKKCYKNYKEFSQPTKEDFIRALLPSKDSTNNQLQQQKNQVEAANDPKFANKELIQDKKQQIASTKQNNLINIDSLKQDLIYIVDCSILETLTIFEKSHNDIKITQNCSYIHNFQHYLGIVEKYGILLLTIENMNLEEKISKLFRFIHDEAAQAYKFMSEKQLFHIKKNPHSILLVTLRELEKIIRENSNQITLTQSHNLNSHLNDLTNTIDSNKMDDLEIAAKSIDTVRSILIKRTVYLEKAALVSDQYE